MDILRWFKKEYSDIVNAMKNTEHDYDLDHQNPFHMEGDVWTHTMLVYQKALEEDKNDIELKLMALLHDIGKPFCMKRNDDTKRVSFSGHGEYSAFMAVDILNEFELYFNVEINKELILKVINWHIELNRIGKVKDGSFSLSSDDTTFLSKKYSDYSFYYHSLLFAKIDGLGRLTKTLSDDITRFDYLFEYEPYPLSKPTNLTSRPIFIMVAGLPCSGKSTEIEKIVKDGGKEFEIISADTILENMATYQSYADIRNKKNMSKAIIEVKNRLKIACNERKNIILDMTNLDAESRDRFLEKVPTKYYFKKGINFINGVKSISVINNNRKAISKFIPFEAIQKMACNYEYMSEVDFDKVEFKIQSFL